MSEHDGIWSAVIRAEYAGGAGERSLQAQSCAEVNRAVLVALSLLEGAIEPVEEPTAPPGDPVGSGGDGPGPAELPNAFETGAVPFARPDPEGRRTPPAAPEPESKPDASKAAPSSDGDPHPASATGVLGLAALLAGEGTELATLGGEVAGALEWNAYRTRLAVGARLPWERVSADHDLELTLWFLTSRLDLCRGWGTRWVASACMGPSLERVSARAPGITDPRAASHWFPGAGASLGLRSSSGTRLNWMTELRFNTRFSSVRTEVVPWGQVYEIPSWSVVLLAGPEFRL